MKTRIAALLFAVVSSIATSQATVLVDTFGDFSTDFQGHNGLQYGYYTSPDVSSGTFATGGMSSAPGVWLGSEYLDTPQFNADRQHPGASLLLPAVRRYTIGLGGEPSYTGLVQIAGSYGGPTPGGGGSVIGFVTVDGITLHSSPSDGSAAAIVNFDFLASVSPGSHIDFGIMANGDANFDSTLFTATVTAVPEPSAALLGLVAFACAWSRRVRHSGKA